MKTKILEYAGKGVFYAIVGIVTSVGARFTSEKLLGRLERPDLTDSDEKALIRYAAAIEKIQSGPSPMLSSQMLADTLESMLEVAPQFRPEIHPHIVELRKAADRGFGDERKVINEVAARRAITLIQNYLYPDEHINNDSTNDPESSQEGSAPSGE